MPDKRMYGFNPEFLPPYDPQNPQSLSYPTQITSPHYPPGINPSSSTNQLDKGFYWVPWNVSRGVPPTAVEGGVDQDGTTIYVGRAYHEGDWVPAKVIPSKHAAYIAYGGQEHVKDEYEVLCEQRFQWIPTHGGNVPHNAVDGGKTSEGETLYVGRCYHDGSHTVGKVHPSHGCLYIPFGGEELKYEDYEILILL